MPKVMGQPDPSFLVTVAADPNCFDSRGLGDRVTVGASVYQPVFALDSGGGSFTLSRSTETTVE